MVSVIISTAVPMQWALIHGPKGDKGDAGPQGVQGPQGPARPAIVFAEWDVSRRTITDDLVWSAEVGTSKFCSTFDYNWENGTIFLEYDDYIGFWATMQVKMQRDGPVTFTIGSDDGSELRIDGVKEMDHWRSHGYQTESITINLTQGIHTLTLAYYEESSEARVSFDCDSDILMWYD